MSTGYITWSHFVVDVLAPTVKMCVSTSLLSITYHQWQYFLEHQLQQSELSPHPLHSELWGCVDCWPLGWYWPLLKQEQTYDNQKLQPGRLCVLWKAVRTGNYQAGTGNHWNKGYYSTINCHLNSFLPSELSKWALLIVTDDLVWGHHWSMNMHRTTVNYNPSLSPHHLQSAPRGPGCENVHQSRNWTIRSTRRFNTFSAREGSKSAEVSGRKQ